MMDFPETGIEKEHRALLSLKPKMFHIFALMIILSIAHSLLFLAHFSGIISDTSTWVFWLNAALLALFMVAFVQLVKMNRHVYEVSRTAVTELQGLVHREKRTLPLDKVFAYRMNRSLTDHILGTAHLTIVGSGGIPAITISFADYSEARNAENLLDALLLDGAAGKTKAAGRVAEGAAKTPERESEEGVGGVAISGNDERWWRNG